jgi:UDP-N-acetyl-D-glucosamine dehydrogenase
MQQPSVPDLLANLKNKTACIGVIGLGYVGLPLCMAIAHSGSKVLGFDVDPAKVASLAEGRSYIRHIGDDQVQGLSRSGLFSATDDFARLPEADVILICVPTPLSEHREPDLSAVESTARTIAGHLRPGQLVILESTSYPGTSEEVIRPVLEATGLKSGRDVFIAYSPEREDPGSPDFTTSRIPKVVGGDGPDALALADAFYAGFVVQTVPVSTMATAEAVKITENIFRAVNIALVNELKVIYRDMGVDIWEVIEAAKTKPFGFMPFYPGPGLGGHCVPIDPFYLTWKAREFGTYTRFIELAGEINSAMPDYVVSQLARELDARARKGLNGARVLVVGVAYKKNIGDVRESPAFRIFKLLDGRKADFDYYDPYVPELPDMREYPQFAGRKCVAWDPGALAGYDAAVIVTDHDCVDYAGLVGNVPLVVDTRNACVRAGVAGPNIVSC